MDLNKPHFHVDIEATNRKDGYCLEKIGDFMDLNTQSYHFRRAIIEKVLDGSKCGERLALD